MNSDVSSSLNLKYHRLTTSGCKDIGIGKFKFVTKTQFLWKSFNISGNFENTKMAKPIHGTDRTIYMADLWLLFKENILLR